MAGRRWGSRCRTGHGLRLGPMAADHGRGPVTRLAGRRIARAAPVRPGAPFSFCLPCLHGGRISRQPGSPVAGARGQPAPHRFVFPQPPGARIGRGAEHRANAGRSGCAWPIRCAWPSDQNQVGQRRAAGRQKSLRRHHLDPGQGRIDRARHPWHRRKHRRDPDAAAGTLRPASGLPSRSRAGCTDHPAGISAGTARALGQAPRTTAHGRAGAAAQRLHRPELRDRPRSRDLGGNRR